jgi:thymidylate synthase
MKSKFKNANEAFRYFYRLIDSKGLEKNETKEMYNIGFYILNPEDNVITCENRNFNLEYAEYEWQWYLSENPNAEAISKRAKIWKNHMDNNGNVMSNYGWQWNRNHQLEFIIDMLKKNKETRRAVLSIYDAKEIGKYKYDTPCTNSIHFQIINNKLCMTVNMRSNDLWFGFCNDQYCFSNLQKMISNELYIGLGWYYHFTSNMHLYNQFLNKQI